jgi:hypothetical protein
MLEKLIKEKILIGETTKVKEGKRLRVKKYKVKKISVGDFYDLEKSKTETSKSTKN